MQNTSNSTGPATRREFLKKTAIASAAVAAAPFLRTPVYGQDTAPSVGVIGANNRINVGYIGVGGQGFNAHVTLMKKHATENNIAQVAVCDVWKYRVDRAKTFIDDPGCKGYSDYNQLLEQKDIDAVVIATHDPIHAPATIAALGAGKHVYVEKPLTRYLPEAFAIQDAVKKSGKILQLGSQGCSAQAWHEAAKIIEAGGIGKPVWAQGYYCRNSKEGEWNYKIDTNFKNNADVNWDAWLGGVKKRVPFNPEHYFRWRKFFPYCAGLLGDLVPHRLNPLMVATGNPQFPTRVVCVGTRPVGADNTSGALMRDVPEHVEIIAEFPNGFSMVIGASTVNAKSPGFVIYGHKATLEIGNAGERLKIVPELPFTEEIEMDELTGLQPIEDIGAHHKNWLVCIRDGGVPNANIDLATKVQTVVSLAEMSERLGVACYFDEKTRKITTGLGSEAREIAPMTYGTSELS